MAKGKVTFSESIEEKVFDIGKLLDKSLEPGINSVKELTIAFNALKSSALEYSNVEQRFKVSQGRKEFLEAKQQEEIASIKARNAIKLEKESKIALAKVEAEELRNKKLLLDVQKKEITQKNKSIKNTISRRVQIQATTKALKQQAREELGLVDAYEKLNNKRTKAQRTLANLLSADKQNIKQIKIAQREYNILDKRVKQVDAATKNYSKNVGNYKSAIGSLTGTLRSLISALGLVGGAMAFVTVMRNAIKIVRNFGASMSNLAGIYRVSRKDLAELEAQIISVAGSSVKTATEVAKLAEALATLGKTKEEIADLLEPVNNLAIGLNATSEETAEFLVQTINAFGGSSEEAEKYADTIATIRTSTSLDFQKMRDSFQYLTPISKILNKDLAYTGALIGLLADNGVKAERAGRLLGTAQQKLSKEGRTLIDALQEINEASARGVKEVDLLKIASDLFGKQAASLGIILAQNSEKIDINAEAIRNNGGALNDLVNEQLQSLDAHFKILNSRWEEYILNTNKSTGASNKLKSGLKFLSDNLDKIINVTITVVKWFGIYKAVMFVSANTTKLMVGANTLYRLSLVAVRGGIKKTIASLTALKIATAASGIGLFLVAIGAAYELFQAFSSGANDAANAQKKLNKEIEDFNNAGNEYSKTILSYKKGSEQIGAVMETQEGILKRVSSNLKKSRDEDYQSNQEHVRQAKKLIQETTETDVSAIRKRIQTAATFSKKQEDYLVREIARYQAAEKIYKENIKFLDEEDAKQLKKQEEKNKKTLEIQKKLNQDAYNLAKFRIEQEIKTQDEILKNKEITGLEKIRAVQEREEKEIQLAELTEKHLLSNKSLTSDARILIEEKTSAKLVEIYKKTNSEIEKIKKDAIDNAPELVDEDDSTAEEDIKILQDGIKAYAESLGLNGQDALNEFVKLHGNKFEAVREYYDNLDNKAKESAEYRKQLENDLKDASIEFVNTLFDRKIQKYEDDITASDAKFDRQLEREDLTDKQRDEIEKKKELERKKLEKKKREEQRKQAIFNKAIGVVDTIINTASAVTKALPNIPLSILAGALGAVQLATIIAQPIPKYKFGRGKGKNEFAEVGDGFVHEVIEKGDGSAYLTPNKPTVTYLEKDDVVHSSLDKYLNSKKSASYYDNIFKASMLASVDTNNNRLKNAKQSFDGHFQKINEKAIENAISNGFKKQKVNFHTTTNNNVKVDLNYALWRAKNLNRE